MENEEQPKITIDELARMVQGGFAEMREKIETSVGSFRSETKAEFAAVNKRIDAVQQSLGYRSDQLDAKLDQHRQETKDGFAAFQPIIGSLSHTVVDHEQRIKELEGE